MRLLVSNPLPAPWSPRPLRVRLASAALGQDPPEDPAGDPGVEAGSPSGGGDGGSLGPVSGVPGPSGGAIGPETGPVQGNPMPASPPQGGFGFPGTFPTMGPANTIFGFGGGGGWGWDWPYRYAYPPPPGSRMVCEWEETPPKEDTKLICTLQPIRYPVVWGPPGWGW